MTKFYCWYDNGTGWFEGPYIEDHKDWHTAYKNNDVGYGAYVSRTGEDPNKLNDKEVIEKHEENKGDLHS